jgi:hypothetical protein
LDGLQHKLEWLIMQTLDGLQHWHWMVYSTGIGWFTTQAFDGVQHWHWMIYNTGI